MFSRYAEQWPLSCSDRLDSAQSSRQPLVSSARHPRLLRHCRTEHRLLAMAGKRRIDHSFVHSHTVKALVPEIRHSVLLVVVCTTLISAAWWQNFVHPASFLPPVRALAKFAGRLTECRSKTYVLVSLCKCGIYFFCIFYYLTPK